VDFSRFSRRLRVLAGVGLAAVLVTLIAFAVHRRLVCAALFMRLEKSAEPGWLVHYRERSVKVSALSFPGGHGTLYTPVGEEAPEGIVLAHGMHEEGIDEPRLVSLARSLAGAGFLVLTPEVTGLAHYKITHDDVDRIAAASKALAQKLGRRQVTVFGISFGGGLALRAACEPATRAFIGRVIALGAHHDAVRVSRFYLGEPALGPTGEPALVEPHPYGRVALWMSLFDEPHKGEFTEAERARALRGVTERTPELERASPRSCPEPVRVPVFLVHGTADRVVPYTETLWNEQQLARQTEVHALVSAAIAHAEYTPPSWWDRLTLIEFMVGAVSGL
jgi:pimeloyl-ACP methyl ester carboxylesterase